MNALSLAPIKKFSSPLQESNEYETTHLQQDDYHSTHFI